MQGTPNLEQSVNKLLKRQIIARLDLRISQYASQKRSSCNLVVGIL